MDSLMLVIVMGFLFGLVPLIVRLIKGDNGGGVLGLVMCIVAAPFAMPLTIGISIIMTIIIALGKSRK